MSFFRYTFSRSRRFDHHRPRGMVSYFVDGHAVSRAEQSAYFAAHQATAEVSLPVVTPTQAEHANRDLNSDGAYYEKQPLAA